MKRFISVQMGARLSYAVPAILEKAGLLEALYTDLCASAGLGELLDRLCPQSLRSGALGRLLNRRVPSNLQGRVHTFDWATLRYLVRQRWAGSDPIEQHRAMTIFGEEFSQAMIKKGLGEATHLYTMFSEGPDFIKFAKGQGLEIVSDIFISPSTDRIVQQEIQQFSDMESAIPPEIIDQDDELVSNLSQLADVFIAPSQFVIEGLTEFGIESARCRLVPYAVDDSWFEIKNSPCQGRVLFVGSANLRKGIHVLGMAAQKLSHRDYEFRIAGDVSEVMRHHTLTQELHFLGRVPRSEIKQEYRQADILVLPSLAEGSAGVTYEALAVGLPVITTEAAGSVVRDGLEGFIVPERDPGALADRIEALVENRELRDRMAAAAKERAQDYTWDRYAERLLTVFESV